MPANAWLDTRCVAEALLGAVHRLPVASKRWAGRQVLQVFPSLLGLALCFFLKLGNCLFFYVCVLPKRKKQKARPKGVNLLPSNAKKILLNLVLTDQVIWRPLLQSCKS